MPWNGKLKVMIDLDYGCLPVYSIGLDDLLSGLTLVLRFQLVVVMFGCGLRF